MADPSCEKVQWIWTKHLTCYPADVTTDRTRGNVSSCSLIVFLASNSTTTLKYSSGVNVSTQKPAAMDSCFGLVRPHQHSTASTLGSGVQHYQLFLPFLIRLYGRPLVSVFSVPLSCRIFSNKKSRLVSTGWSEIFHISLATKRRSPVHFKVANLPYWPRGWLYILMFHFPTNEAQSFF